MLFRSGEYVILASEGVGIKLESQSSAALLMMGFTLSNLFGIWGFDKLPFVFHARMSPWLSSPDGYGVIIPSDLLLFMSSVSHSR